jgi:hypothetical protein
MRLEMLEVYIARISRLLEYNLIESANADFHVSQLRAKREFIALLITQVNVDPH